MSDGAIRNSFLHARWIVAGVAAACFASEAELDRPTSFVDLFSQIIQRCRDFCGIDWFHASSCFFQIDDPRGERNERLDLAELARLDVELSQLVLEMVFEEYVIDLAVLAHGVEVETLQ